MTSFFRTPDRKKKYILIGLDAIGVILSLFLSFLVQMIYRGKLSHFIDPVAVLPLLPKAIAIFNLCGLFLGFCFLFGLMHLVVYYALGLYEIEVVFNRKKTLIKAAVAVFCGVFLSYSLFGLLSKRVFLLEIWLFHLCSLFLILLGWRYLVFTKFAFRNPFQIVFLGNDDLVNKATAYLTKNGSQRFFELRSYTEDNVFGSDIGMLSPSRPNMIVYPYSNGLPTQYYVSLMRKKLEGISVCDSVTFYKNCTGSLPVFHMDVRWLMSLSTSFALSKPFPLRVKRLIDMGLSLIGIILTLPLMVLIAGIIKMTSKGPVMFRQERLGLHERPFLLYKFRTMIENAEKATGPVWAQDNDPRITVAGKILRKTRLDELPQFFNILKGDMSFIGPRPIRKFFAEKLSTEFPYYFLRFHVKPGLTGWAQVSAGYGDSVEEQLKKLEYELFYIFEYSLFLDSVILLKTIQKVLWAKGQ